jgi:hypothetical protein
MEELHQQEEKRPTFLTVLCILTFINVGINSLILMFQLVSGPTSEEDLLADRVELARATSQLEDAGMDGFVGVMDQLMAMTAQIQENFYLAMIVALVTYLIGLLGAFKMWQGQKIGFHLYIIYSLLAVGGVYLYISPQNIPSISIIFGLILSGAFVFMYSRNLSWLK